MNSQKTETVYVCGNCGQDFSKWQGKCPHCEAWNTLVESVAEGAPKNRYNTAARGLIGDTSRIGRATRLPASSSGWPRLQW